MPQIIDVPGMGNVEFPDGMSDQDIVAAIQKNTTAPAKPATTFERFLGSPTGSTLLGVSDLLTGPAQLGLNIGSKISKALPGHDAAYDPATWANETMASLNAMSERGRAAQGREGFDAFRLAGSMGTGAVAGGLGAKAAAVAPDVASAAHAASNPIKAYLANVLRGTASGAFYGGTAAPQESTVPTTNDYLRAQGDKAKVGGLLGFGLSGVVAPVVKGAYNFVEPYLPHGVEKQSGRTLAEAAGPRRRAVEAELSTPHEPYTTAGQKAARAGSAEFSALGKIVEKRLPSDYAAMEQRAKDAARGEVQRIGGTPSQLEAAITARKATADAGYAKVRAGTDPVNTQEVVAYLDDMAEQNPGNPDLLRELKEIRRGLVEETGKGLPEYAQRSQLRDNAGQVASSVEGIKGSLEHERNKGILTHLNDLKNRLINVVPGLRETETRFATDSVPINRMQYGQELERRLIPAMDDKVTPRSFADARRQAGRTISGATGNTIFEREADFLTPAQRATLDALEERLERNALNDRLASRGTEAARRLVAEEVGPVSMPNALWRPLTYLHYGVNRLRGKAGTDVQEYLAKVMQDDTATSELMRRADPGRRAMVKAILERGLTDATTIGASKVQ